MNFRNKIEKMELIPEDMKADLKKAPSVEVILGHTFRVWHNGRIAKDYWVRNPIFIVI